MPTPLPHDPLWPQVGQTLGPWLILRHHDLEGSGDMFLAQRQDGAFDREVLITLQRPTAPGAGHDPSFLAERELQGRLDHPGIAKVLGAGQTQGGLPYLVTEFLDGLDIEAHLDSQEASVADRVRAFQQVCQAVHHAHQRGIHGLNLQASNVHLMPDGSLRIVVFGLAQWNQVEGHALPEDPVSLAEGGPIFAGEYASPEQWSAQKPAATSDVYSLGALLYRLLTGTSPQELKGLTPAEARKRVQTETPDKASSRAANRTAHAPLCGCTPSQLPGKLSGDLDRILSKALAQLQKHRYASALDLSEDLDRHLASQPIRARGPAPIYALGRSLQRYRVPLSLFLSVVLVLGWALGRSFATDRRTNEALIEARALEADAEALGQRLRDLCVRFLTELGPSMQGRPGLEDARRYLLNVSAPLLDHLRQSGHQDTKLAIHLCRSYSELAEAEYVSYDLGAIHKTPESSRKAIALCTDLIAQVPKARRLEAFYYYSRSVRAGIWFSVLTLDSAGGREILANIPRQLASVGMQESEVAALTQVFLAESRRAFYVSELQFGSALEAWDLDRLRSLAEASPTLLPFFEADYSRFASMRAGDLIHAGRGQEALYELPTLVYQMGEEVAAHNPPVLSLLGNETDAWINLAQVRVDAGMPPGEALMQASRHLQTIRNRFTREPGANLILLGAEQGLGTCKLSMGSEFQVEAKQHLDQAAELLSTILQGGARWPSLQVRLAEIHLLRARACNQLQLPEQARTALLAGFEALSTVPAEAALHTRYLHVRCTLDLETYLQVPSTQTPDWRPLEEALQILEDRKISAPLLAVHASKLAELRLRHGKATPNGGPSK